MQAELRTLALTGGCANHLILVADRKADSEAKAMASKLISPRILVVCGKGIKPGLIAATANLLERPGVRARAIMKRTVRRGAGMGGHVSGPCGLAAWSPASGCTHEQNRARWAKTPAKYRQSDAGVSSAFLRGKWWMQPRCVPMLALLGRRSNVYWIVKVRSVRVGSGRRTHSNESMPQAVVKPVIQSATSIRAVKVLQQLLNRYAEAGQRRATEFGRDADMAAAYVADVVVCRPVR